MPGYDRYCPSGTRWRATISSDRESYDPDRGLGVVSGVGEAVRVESGRGAGVGLEDGEDGFALSPTVGVGETTGVDSGSRAGAGLEAGSGRDGMAAGEGDGPTLPRISLRRFKICSRV